MSDGVSLTYIGPFQEVEVDPLDGSSHFVAREESKEFPADIADNLLEEPTNWRPEKLKVSEAAAELAESSRFDINVNRLTDGKGSVTVKHVESAIAEAEKAEAEAAEPEVDDAGEEPDPPDDTQDEEE